MTIQQVTMAYFSSVLNKRPCPSFSSTRTQTLTPPTHPNTHRASYTLCSSPFSLCHSSGSFVTISNSSRISLRRRHVTRVPESPPAGGGQRGGRRWNGGTRGEERKGRWRNVLERGNKLCFWLDGRRRFAG